MLKIPAIVLAAGASSRMGQSKMTLPFRGSTVIGSVVSAIQAAGLKDIIVVTGHHDALVRDSLFGIEVRFAHNPDPERGMLSSLQCGLRAASDPDYAIVALGDQPHLPKEAIARLIQSLELGDCSMIAIANNHRPGHPMLLRREVIRQLLDEKADIPLNSALEMWRANCRLVELDWPDSDRDMDTPEDYQVLTNPNY